MANTGTKTAPKTKVYAALADQLRQAIHDGVFKPGQSVGSEYSLAREESISRMTVRRASDLLVREGLIERRPGKGLYVRDERTTTRVIRVVAGKLQWEPCLQAARAVKSAGADCGIETLLYDAHGDTEADLEMLKALPAQDVSGAVVISLHSKAFNEAIYDLKRQKFPFVLVDQKFQDIDVPSVMADNYDGGYQAGRHLLDHGHKRIGFMGDLVATTVRGRLAGFRDAVSDAGLAFDRSLIVDVGEHPDHDRFSDLSGEIDRRLRPLIQREDRPTAVFFSCDAFARAGCRTLSDLGFEVPKDLSVVGFDDDPLSQWMTPQLTTVRQPFFEMGQAALEILSRAMTHPEQDQAESRVVPVSLITRDSVAGPRV